MDERDHELISLSDEASAALAEFNSQRHLLDTELARIQVEAEDDFIADRQLSMDLFTEDWSKSQFWYSDETAKLFAENLIEGSSATTVIGLVSAPSVFIALRNMLHSRKEIERPKLVLLEHDKRFEIYSEFVNYDYREPLKLSPALKGSIDRIFCDPPFLSEDCQTKAATTIRWLLKDVSAGLPRPRVVICTGERHVLDTMSKSAE
ncbi:Protein-lysine N-methyltransferase EFM5 [Ophiocordyceps camponoti-floridani]|uniref:Protein-lysine N-methyltransferase EFM5 n=1 Tax=Ophiocordyceps camponoti-floridani TaxID=2030778 RepID=A0A8H4QBE3_9HYPO|nr:Protein-lysine N-methyltransferase EFM5 [Ophiocordyceps camponoti-floridani]